MRYDGARETILYVSDDYFLYTAPATMFDVSKGILDRLPPFRGQGGEA